MLRKGLRATAHLLRPLKAAYAHVAGLPAVVTGGDAATLAYRTGYARTWLAGLWRRGTRLAMVASGLILFAMVEWWIAGEIAGLRWWFILAIFIAVASTALAMAKPVLAFLFWLVVSPIASHLFSLDWGPGVPAITFDRTVLYLLTIVILARALVNRAPLRKPRLGEALLFLFPVYIVCTSPFFAQQSATAFFYMLLARAGDLCILYIVANGCITKREHVTWVAAALIFVGIYSTAMAFFDHFTGRMSLTALVGAQVRLIWSDVGGRAAGPFLNPANLGIMLGITALLIILASRPARRGILKFALYAMLPLVLLALFWTYTRGGYVPLIAGLILMPIWAGWSRRPYAVLLGIVLLGAALAVPIALTNKDIHYRLTTDKTAKDRIITGAALVNVIKHNFWFGIGLGNGNEAITRYVISAGGLPGLRIWRGVGSWKGRFELPAHTNSHSTYLTIIAEHGVLGGLLFVGSIAAFFTHIWRARKMLPWSGYLGRDFAALAAAVVVAYVICSNTLVIGPHEYVSFVVWILVVCVCRLSDFRAADSRRLDQAPTPNGELAAGERT